MSAHQLPTDVSAEPDELAGLDVGRSDAAVGLPGMQLPHATWSAGLSHDLADGDALVTAGLKGGRTAAGGLVCPAGMR